jgi:hypothetical protein
VPPEILARMRRAGEKGREHALHEGIAIAREMFEQVRPVVQGLQVSAPFGRVDYALQVFDGVPGIRTDMPEEEPGVDEVLGFTPPWQREALVPPPLPH